MKKNTKIIDIKKNGVASIQINSKYIIVNDDKSFKKQSNE